MLADDTEVPYDLFLGIPVHVRPPVVVESGLTVDGWIPVDPATLATTFPDVYAVGDVTSVGTPKAGVFAESQGKVVADAIVARHRGGDSDPVRRPRDLLHRVRRRGRWARSSASVRARGDAHGPVRRPVPRHRGRQGRVRSDARPRAGSARSGRTSSR